MKFGIFGDPHITKKIREFQTEWELSIINTFTEMYKIFLENKVDFVICTGDFFDKSILEARSVPLVNKVRDIMSSIPTYILLGNHEIDSNEHNILDAFEGIDDNFIPVTSLYAKENILFIPYNVDLCSVEEDLLKDKIVITHHDIYGSTLAGGKTFSSFGYDPDIFKSAKIVLNGHVHLRSLINNIYNIGSLFSTQFGELKEDSSDYPMYYIYDDKNNSLCSYINKNSLYYVTCDLKNIEDTLNNKYKNLNIILKISYDEDFSIEDLCIPENVLKVSKRKRIKNEGINDTEIIKDSVNIDIKEMIVQYLYKDTTISDDVKERIKLKCFNLLGG